MSETRKPARASSVIGEPKQSIAKRAVPVLALDVSEACEALGVSPSFWRAEVAPEVRIVRRGRRKLVAVAELERWLAESAERSLERRS